MRKQLFYLASLAMMVLLSLSFVSCGDDDEKDDPGGNTNSEIQGTWGLILKEYNIPNEKGGLDMGVNSYDYLNPSKEDELVISLIAAERGDPYYTLRQYFYDYNEQIWTIISKEEAFVNNSVLSFTDNAGNQSFNWSVKSNKLVLENKEPDTDYFIRYTFKKVSSEVKETNTLHIVN